MILKSIRKMVYLIGFTILFGFSIVLIRTFMLAYFSPSKSVMIHIDFYNEATFEFALMIIAIPIICYLYYDILKNLIPKLKAGEI